MEKQTILKSCVDCGVEYEAVVLMDTGNVLSPYCPKCREVRIAEYDEKEKLTEEIERKRVVNLRLQQLGIPKRFSEESFDTYIPKNRNQEKLLGLCKRYASEFSLKDINKIKSLGILGSWGVGKTHLVCAIAKKLVEIFTPIYTTESRLFLRIRDTFNHNSSETEQGVYNKLISVPLLIIDDVGKEDVADPRFVQRVWFNIINGRYENCLPIIITSNLSVGGIANHLGGSRDNEASFDRLFEMLGGVFWELEGTTYRKNKI